jgi:4-aminobutyrate aminotransferase-like enzyme/Ser/Thr protein kinase RdoA (MazF antagonist)
MAILAPENRRGHAMPLTTLMQRSGLPSPQVDLEQARQLLQDHYGLSASIERLGSQQDVNFRVESVAESGAIKRHVLKICHGNYAASELLAQHGALAHLAAQGLKVPGVVEALNGESLLSLCMGGQPVRVRLLDYIDGTPLTHQGFLGPHLLARLGHACAEIDIGLAAFEHPGLERTLQWDPRHAQPLIDHLLPGLADPLRRNQVALASEQAARHLQPLLASLPVQAVHLDITDDNTLWQRDSQRQWQLQGIIDFGDVLRTWRIADLSVTCAALLHHVAGEPFALLPAIAAYHAANPLHVAELRALWPMIVARAAVLVLSSERQLSVDPGNAYIRANLRHEWQIFEVATSVPFELMEVAIQQCVGLQPSLPTALPMSALLPTVIAEEVHRVDLGVLSPGFEAGNWQMPSIDQQLLAEQAGTEGVASSLYGEYRLSLTRIDCALAPASCALHVELHLPLGAAVHAPFCGVLESVAANDLRLVGDGVSLYLSGVQASANEASVNRGVAAGQYLGRAEGVLRVQLCRMAWITPPLFTTALRARAWQALCPSPGPLLGYDCDAAPAVDAAHLLQRRDASFARSQKHYYQAPPHIERGWRNHLIDMQGRSYLDMLNNVAVLGHGHPRMASEAARQWSLLNTNSRFHYAAIAEFSERLLALAPPGMDRVFLVNSGTEANDLAIRLAWAASGGRDMLSVLEAYHGWSVATDAISTSIADNPQALSTRPEWVHPVTAPNTYRGKWRGAESTGAYVADVEATLARLSQQGRQVAGFICEPVYGNAGGIALPPGYLHQVYAKVRALGGVCIADEVQVGYGRLGEHFWGFEEQGVVPDIITMAKGMGNGHPLGAVITRREIAEALEAEGYFFSSAGGSPVSCRIGLAVLDVMEQEQLWNNARDVGRHFKARLEALIDDYPLVGAVHGSGFYLGLELVRDHQTLEPATLETAALCDRLLDLGIFMQPTGDYLNILKIKPPMCTTRQSVDFFVDCVAQVLSEGL